jgi:hypothetical protein
MLSKLSTCQPKNHNINAIQPSDDIKTTTQASHPIKIQPKTAKFQKSSFTAEQIEYDIKDE